MIASEKANAAIRAIQDVVIQGRTMAHEGADHQSMADLLDRTEYLVGMLLEERDMTDVFESNVEELAVLHHCGIALTKYRMAL